MVAGNDGTDLGNTPVPPQHNGATHDASGLNGATPPAAAPAVDASAAANATNAATDAAASAAAAVQDAATKTDGKFMSMIKNNKGMAIATAVVALGAVVYGLSKFRGKEEGASRA